MRKTEIQVDEYDDHKESSRKPTKEEIKKKFLIL